MGVRGATYGVLYTLLILCGAGCTAPLLDGLDEPQANDLMVYLSAAGIGSEKQGRLGRFTISVSRDDFPAAWRIARARGLPHQVATRRSGLFTADQPDAERQQREVEIAAFLRADPAIIDARVALGDRGAAVSVRASAASAVDRARVVARVRAVSGLAPDEPVALDVHPIDPAADRALPTSALDAPNDEAPGSGQPAGLWLASVAVGLMLASCGWIWWRSRRGQRA